MLAPDDDDDNNETGGRVGGGHRRAEVLEGMEGILRDAGRHLACVVTGLSPDNDEDDCTYDAIDPRVAISFVVLVEGRRPSPSPSRT